MRSFSRRSALSAIGAALPLGLGGQARAAEGPAGPAPTLRFESFEEAVRAAFASEAQADGAEPCGGGDFPVRRVEVGHSPEIQAGVQGCHNDRPFAGFPAGHLRIVRAGSGPGPARQGVRLYVATVDIALAGGPTPGVPSRPLDFATLPPAPAFA